MANTGSRQSMLPGVPEGRTLAGWFASWKPLLIETVPSPVQSGGCCEANGPVWVGCSSLHSLPASHAFATASTESPLDGRLIVTAPNESLLIPSMVATVSLVAVVVN